MICKLLYIVLNNRSKFIFAFSSTKGQHTDNSMQFYIILLLLAVFLEYTACELQLDWNQVGTTISGTQDGEGVGKAVASSADGKVIAIGSDGRYSDSGEVRIFQYDGSNWMQMGSDIRGENVEDYFGTAVALSADGNTVAIGAFGHHGVSGEDSGCVQVYAWKGNSWVQVGSNIDGESSTDFSGRTVSISYDGNTVATGAPYNDGVNGMDGGHVRVYTWKDNRWRQMGDDLDGESALDYAGESVSLSADGTSIAIGASYNNGDSGHNSGHVRVYAWNGFSWDKRGGDIDGKSSYDNSGFSASLSAYGKFVAIGAHMSSGNKKPNSGSVRVFAWIDKRWVQQGGDIVGQDAQDLFGFSVSLSADGMRVAIGAMNNNGNSAQKMGRVQVYDFRDSAWVQIGSSLDGISSSDIAYFGSSVSLTKDGTRVIIGAPLATNFAGYAQVYELTCLDCPPLSPNSVTAAPLPDNATSTTANNLRNSMHS